MLSDVRVAYALTYSLFSRAPGLSGMRAINSNFLGTVAMVRRQEGSEATLKVLNRAGIRAAIFADELSVEL